MRGVLQYYNVGHELINAYLKRHDLGAALFFLVGCFFHPLQPLLHVIILTPRETNREIDTSLKVFLKTQPFFLAFTFRYVSVVKQSTWQNQIHVLGDYFTASFLFLIGLTVCTLLGVVDRCTVASQNSMLARRERKGRKLRWNFSHSTPNT